MAVINYAVLIQSDLFDTDWDVGFDNGCFCWITGRPGYDGTVSIPTAPLNPNTGAQQTRWKQSMLLKEGLGSPSYSVDLQDLGSYGTVSDLEIQVKNTANLANYLRGEAIWLFRRKVFFYVIIDNVWYPWWTGVVDGMSFTESKFTFKCVDIYKDIHQDFPRHIIDKSKYPWAKSDLIGKPIPVCFGKVTHAKLYNIRERSDSLPVFISGGGSTRYETPAAAESNGSKTIDLYVGALVVAADAWKGKYLVCVRGGPRQEIRIVTNLASSADPAPVVRVTLEQAYRAGSQDLTPVIRTGITVPLNLWYFSLVDRIQPRIVSDSEIFQFEDSPNGTGGILQVYDKDAGEYLDYSPLLIDSDTFAIGDENFPGVRVKAGKTIQDGSSTLPVVGFIKPGSILRKTHSDGGTVDGNLATLGGGSTWPSVDDTALTNLLDKNRTTKYTIIGNRGTPHVGPMTLRAAFEMTIPEQVYRNWEGGVFLHMDMECAYTNASAEGLSYTISVTVRGKDRLGGTTAPALNNHLHISNSFTGTGSRNHYIIHPSYYGLDGEQGQVSGLLPLHALFPDWKSIRVYEAVSVEIAVTVGSALGTAHAFTFSLNEVTLQAKKYVDVIADDAFSKVQGAVFGSSWLGRKTAGQPVLGIVDAVEKFFQDYEYAGAYVDTASFDAAAAMRPVAQWTVGRQVTERKNSIDYLNELCKAGHFCIVPLPNGKRKIVCWTGNAPDGILTEHSWIAGSLSAIEDIPLRRVFSEVEINYDYDPGLGKCKRTLFVRNTDQSSFPLEATLEPGTSIPAWKFWVGGVNEYAQAQSLWTTGRLGYERTKTKNTLRLDVPWFMSQADWGGDSDDDGPIGLAASLLAWSAIPKKQFSGHLPITPTTIAYTLAEGKSLFDDTLFVDEWRGWFTGLRLNTQKDILEASIIADPEG